MQFLQRKLRNTFWIFSRNPSKKNSKTSDNPQEFPYKLLRIFLQDIFQYFCAILEELLDKSIEEYLNKFLQESLRESQSICDDNDDDCVPTISARMTYGCRVKLKESLSIFLTKLQDQLLNKIIVGISASIPEEIPQNVWKYFRKNLSRIFIDSFGGIS